MKSKTLNFLLLFFAAVSAHAQSPTARSDISHGTLIVAVPTRDGLIICADKRLHSDNKPDNDDYIKLISTYRIFAAAGLVDYTVHETIYPMTSLYLTPAYNFPPLVFPSTTPPSLSLVPMALPSITTELPKTEPLRVIDVSKFNLNQSIEMYYRNPSGDSLFKINRDGTIAFQKNDTQPTLEGLVNKLVRELASIQSDLSREKRLPDLLIETHVFYVTTNDELKQEVIFALSKKDSFGKLYDIELKYGTLDGKEFSIGKPIVWGSPDLYVALLDPKKKEFDKLRKTTAIKLFLAPKPVAQTKSRDALLFARTLIRETARLDHKLYPDIFVSEACDCGLLNPAEGFVEILPKEKAPQFKKLIETVKPIVD